jgi:hypothetical protein
MSKTHPEQRLGEIFLMNASDVSVPVIMRMKGLCPLTIISFCSSWEAIGWETKRRGKIAYDANNIPIAGMFPVFIRAKELLIHELLIYGVIPEES